MEHIRDCTFVAEIPEGYQAAFYLEEILAVHPDKPLLMWDKEGRVWQELPPAFMDGNMY